MQLQHQYQNQSSRPGTSLGAKFFMVLSDCILNKQFSKKLGVHGSADNAVNASTKGARRVTLQERERQDSDIEKRSDYKSMSNMHACKYLLSLSLSEHRLQADELDSEFF